MNDQRCVIYTISVIYTENRFYKERIVRRKLMKTAKILFVLVQQI